MRATPEFGKPKITGYNIEMTADEAFVLLQFFGQLSRKDIRAAVPHYSDDMVDALYKVTSRFYVEVFDAAKVP